MQLFVLLMTLLLGAGTMSPAAAGGQVLRRSAVVHAARQHSSRLQGDPATAQLERRAERAMERGELLVAEEYYRRALLLQERRDPSSPATAHLLVRLGFVKERRKQLGAREYERAFDILTHRTPETATGSRPRERAPESPQAQQDLEQAREALERLEFGEWMAANQYLLLVAMGATEALDNARPSFQHALALADRLQDKAAIHTKILGRLGEMCRRLGSVAEARRYCERAVAICEKQRCKPSDFANLLQDLGDLCLLDQNGTEARKCYERALSLRGPDKTQPFWLSRALTGLGRIAQAQGDLAAARGYFERVLNGETDSPANAEYLIGLGEVLRAQGDASGARGCFQKASSFNLFWLSRYFQMYVEAHDGRFPPMGNMAALRIRLRGMVHDTMFLQPSTGKPYGTNPWLAGKPLKQIDSPGQVVLFYEMEPMDDGTRGVVFVQDDSPLPEAMKRIPEADWARVKQASHLP